MLDGVTNPRLQTAQAFALELCKRSPNLYNFLDKGQFHGSVVFNNVYAENLTHAQFVEKLNMCFLNPVLQLGLTQDVSISDGADMSSQLGDITRVTLTARPLRQRDIIPGTPHFEHYLLSAQLDLSFNNMGKIQSAQVTLTEGHSQSLAPLTFSASGRCRPAMELSDILNSDERAYLSKREHTAASRFKTSEEYIDFVKIVMNIYENNLDGLKPLMKKHGYNPASRFRFVVDAEENYLPFNPFATKHPGQVKWLSLQEFAEISGFDKDTDVGQYFDELNKEMHLAKHLRPR